MLLSGKWPCLVTVIESMPIDLPLPEKILFEIIGTHSEKKIVGRRTAGGRKNFNFLLLFLNIQED